MHTSSSTALLYHYSMGIEFLQSIKLYRWLQPRDIWVLEVQLPSVRPPCLSHCSVKTEEDTQGGLWHYHSVSQTQPSVVTSLLMTNPILTSCRAKTTHIPWPLPYKFARFSNHIHCIYARCYNPCCNWSHHTHLAFGAPTWKASLAGKTRHGPMQSGEARLSQMWKD